MDFQSAICIWRDWKKDIESAADTKVRGDRNAVECETGKTSRKNGREKITSLNGTKSDEITKIENRKVKMIRIKNCRVVAFQLRISYSGECIRKTGERERKSHFLIHFAR